MINNWQQQYFNFHTATFRFDWFVSLIASIIIRKLFNNFVTSKICMMDNNMKNLWNCKYRRNLETFILWKLFKDRKKNRCWGSEVVSTNFLITCLGRKLAFKGRAQGLPIVPPLENFHWDCTDKWGWKKRLGACRRICFSLLIWTFILMEHLTLIQELDSEAQGFSKQSTTTPLAGEW